jgi:ferrochelatase
VADCLETLEEIAQEGKEEFEHTGGGEYHYIPCLNDTPAFIHALADVVQQHTQGWPMSRAQTAQAAPELQQQLAAAQALGAAR